MSSALIEQTRLAYVITKNLRVPKEGPKVIPVQLLFQTNAVTELDLDLLSMIQQNKISMIQAAYIDNGRNGSPLTIIIGSSQMNVTVNPNTQTFTPLFLPNPAKLIFQSAGNIDDIFVHLLNFPVSPAQWKTV